MSKDSSFALDIFTRARDALKEARASSIIEYTRPARVEPIVLLDDSLRHQPFLSDVLQTIVSLFSGYYLQAISLSCNIGEIDVLRLLEKMNPQRDPLDSAMLGGSRVAGWLAKEAYEEGRLPGVEQRNKRQGFDDLGDMLNNPDNYKGKTGQGVKKPVVSKAQSGRRPSRPVVVARGSTTRTQNQVNENNLTEEDVNTIAEIVKELGDDATAEEVRDSVRQVLEQEGTFTDDEVDEIARQAGYDFQQQMDNGQTIEDSHDTRAPYHSVPIGTGDNPNDKVTALAKKHRIKRNQHGKESYFDYYKRVMMADGFSDKQADEKFHKEYLVDKDRYLGGKVYDPDRKKKMVQNQKTKIKDKVEELGEKATAEDVEEIIEDFLEQDMSLTEEEIKEISQQINEDYQKLVDDGMEAGEAAQAAYEKSQEDILKKTTRQEEKKQKREKQENNQSIASPPSKNKPMAYQYAPQAQVEFGTKTIADLSTNINLSVGKMLEVKITSGGSEATIPVSVRLIVRPVPSSAMAILLTKANKKTSWRDRYHKWRAGELRLIQDILLCQDLIDDHKKALMADKDGALRSIMGRGSKNKISALLSGDISVANASSIIIVSKTVSKEIERRLNIRLNSFKHREELFRSTYTMLLVVIDVEWEQLVIYHRSIQDPSEMTVREAKNSGSEGGSNIGDILSAYKLGTAPSL